MAGPYALAGRDRPGECCDRAAIDDTLKVLVNRTSWESSSVGPDSLPQQDIHIHTPSVRVTKSVALLYRSYVERL